MHLDAEANKRRNCIVDLLKEVGLSISDRSLDRNM